MSGKGFDLWTDCPFGDRWLAGLTARARLDPERTRTYPPIYGIIDITCSLSVNAWQRHLDFVLAPTSAAH